MPSSIKTGQDIFAIEQICTMVAMCQGRTGGSLKPLMSLGPRMSEAKVVSRNAS